MTKNIISILNARLKVPTGFFTELDSVSNLWGLNT